MKKNPKIVIVGAGNIGKQVFWDLYPMYPGSSISICDNNASKQQLCQGIVSMAKACNIKTKFRYSPTNTELIDECKDADLVIGCVPGRFGLDLLNLITGTIKKPYVDVSFMPEDLVLGDIVCNFPIIFDMGIAPGISNILAMECCKGRLNDTVEIFVGALPKNPRFPLFHTFNWSVEDTLEEYTRKARIKENGKIVERNALDSIYSYVYPNKGLNLEAFLSDGARTLLKTLPVDTVKEYTLRSYGHLQFVKGLYDLGLLHDRDGIKAIKKGIARSGFQNVSGDYLHMRVTGWHGKSFTIHHESENSAIAETTSAGVCFGAKLLLEGHITKPGIYAPEQLFDAVGHLDLFGMLKNFLHVRGIEIS